MADYNHESWRRAIEAAVQNSSGYLEKMERIDWESVFRSSEEKGVPSKTGP